MSGPDSARYARDAAEAIGARFEDMDNGGGYLFRISRNNRSVLGGGGNICTYPVNSATAYTISRDKAHTKTLLAAHGIPVIPGALFFAHDRRIALRTPGREAHDAMLHAATQGFPVFCKPNHGSRGMYAEIVATPVALRDYVARVAADFESFLVEPVRDGTEHRVFVQDGRPIFHSTKATPHLTGDGASTLAQLLADLNEQVRQDGVSALPVSVLGNRDPQSVPPAGAHIPLPGRRNLSAAGAIEAVSETMPDALAQTALAAVRALDLNIGAVDMFDLSPARDFTDIVVIEVNGNPGLRTLELAGRSDLIRSIWTNMLNACLDS